MYGAESAGNIRYQLGNVLLAGTRAIEEGDVLREADLTGRAITVCTPKLSEDEERDLRGMTQKAKAAFAGDRRDRDGAHAAALHEACEATMSALLRRMSDRGLYAFTEAKVTDARKLALRDDEEETTPGEPTRAGDG